MNFHPVENVPKPRSLTADQANVKLVAGFVSDECCDSQKSNVVGKTHANVRMSAGFGRGDRKKMSLMKRGVSDQLPCATYRYSLLVKGHPNSNLYRYLRSLRHA